MFRELAADHLDITDDKIVALVDAFMVLFENVNFRLTIMCLSDIIFFYINYCDLTQRNLIFYSLTNKRMYKYLRENRVSHGDILPS